MEHFGDNYGSYFVTLGKWGWYSVAYLVLAIILPSIIWRAASSEIPPELVAEYTCATTFCFHNAEDEAETMCVSLYRDFGFLVVHFVFALYWAIYMTFVNHRLPDKLKIN
jgi:hypothetical protein